MDPDSAPPVDFDLLEQQKENIYPTQAGRKASALVSFFSTPSTDPADREASFKAQRADFEARIAEAARFDAERRKSTPDPSLPTYDPLELHHRYVRWFQDAYPSGHDDLLKVVEKAIRSVKHLETYKKDPRYLRLWILVAKHQEDPTAVFKYLSVNGIGQTISTYYTEYATLLEALNKYREAEEIYKLGIERRAEPLDKLKYKYNAFQRRMMLPKNSPAPDPPPSTAQPERTVQPLTTLSRPTASSRSRADPARTTTAPAPSALRTEPHHHNTASNRPLPPKIEVYRDTENAAPELGKQLLPTEADTNVWNEFEILNRSKENKMGVVPLKGAVVDIGPSTKKLAVKIEVYRDPVAETAAKENAVPVVAVPPAQPKPLARPPQQKPAEPALETFVTLLELFNVNGEEFSFEEIRAARLGLLGMPTVMNGDGDGDVEMEVEDMTTFTRGVPKKIKVSSPDRASEIEARVSSGMFLTDSYEDHESATPLGSPRREERKTDDIVCSINEIDRAFHPPITVLQAESLISVGDAERESGAVDHVSAIVPDSQRLDVYTSPISLNPDGVYCKDESGIRASPLHIENLVQQEHPASTGFELPPISSMIPLEFGRSSPNNPSSTTQNNQQPSPTINTKKAQGDLKKMFDFSGADAFNSFGPKLDFEEPEAKEPQFSPPKRFAVVDNDDETISSKVYFKKSDFAAAAGSRMQVYRDPESGGPQRGFGEGTGVRGGLFERVAGFEVQNGKENQPIERVRAYHYNENEEDHGDENYGLPDLGAHQRASAFGPMTPIAEVSFEGFSRDRISILRQSSFGAGATESAVNTASSGSKSLGIQEVFSFGSFASATGHMEDENDGFTDHIRLDQTHLSGISTIRSVLGRKNFNREDGLVEKTVVTLASDPTVHNGSNGTEIWGSHEFEYDRVDDVDTLMRMDELKAGLAAAAEESAASTPIDPLHASVTENILKELELPLEKRPGFVDLRGNVFYQMLKLGQSLAGAAVETRSPTHGTSRKASRSPEHEAPKMRFQLPIPRDAAAAPRDEEEEDEEEEEVMISLSLVRKLGEGGFATVYLVEKVPIGLLEDEEDDEYGKPCRQENSSGERELVALKMQSVSDGRWEFYILSELIERLAHPEGANEEISAMLRRATESMVQCDALHLFKQESALSLRYAGQGTILDCVNRAARGGYGSTSDPGVDELLAIFFMVEVLRTMEAVHVTGMIHRDMKPDNVMVRLEGDGSEWRQRYRADGGDGWSDKGVRIIDWGTGVDVTRFAAGQDFIVESRGKQTEGPDSSYECWEMRNGAPWTYEADWYGAASVAHVLLFGRYMVVEEEREGGDGVRPRVKVAGHMKRYWQTAMWKALFEVLLNCGVYNRRMVAGESLESVLRELGIEAEVGQMPTRLEREFPVIGVIRSIRRSIERWLESNCSKNGKSLHGLLRKVEVAVGGKH